ncbi:MAG: NAD(P)-dependent oxidoreductase [Nitrososphaeria archaeon]
MVNVYNKDVIIFGGKVALRKAKKLLDLGANVYVVSKWL